MLGGSSCLNVLLYHRGTAEDYNTWASMANSDEWNANNVLPYFKKSEDNFRGSSEFHGVGGEYSVSQVRYENPLSKTYLEACKELNFMENNDFNDWSRSQEGVGRYDVNEKNGARCSAASGFLKPVMKRKNLKVVSSALVKKVNIQNKKTSGVDVEVNGRSFQVNLKNGGEVLLCGGAISSPHILMLSGVGPKNHLESHGIHCIENLPGVGQNLQDHPAAVVSFDVKPQHAGISSASKIRIPGTTLINPIVLMQWLLFRSGPLTSVGCDYGGFFKTDSSNKLPDLQMRFLAAKALSPDGMATYSKVSEMYGILQKQTKFNHASYSFVLFVVPSQHSKFRWIQFPIDCG